MTIDLVAVACRAMTELHMHDELDRLVDTTWFSLEKSGTYQARELL